MVTSTYWLATAPFIPSTAEPSPRSSSSAEVCPSPSHLAEAGVECHLQLFQRSVFHFPQAFGWDLIQRRVSKEKGKGWFVLFFSYQQGLLAFSRASSGNICLFWNGRLLLLCELLPRSLGIERNRRERSRGEVWQILTVWLLILLFHFGSHQTTKRQGGRNQDITILVHKRDLSYNK